ncbi:MAG: LysR family transcriptional regulator [Rhodospirillales bacterium]
MRYIQLRAFNAVAREQSFSKAAEALNVTQPAITLHVQALERTHGLKLFTRAGRGISLTADGEALFQLTRQMFATETEIAEYLQGSEALEHGHLSLSADGPHVALDIVSEFRTRHPGIDIRMRLGNAETTLADVMSQTVDVCVVANPPRNNQLLIVPIMRQSMVAVVANDHAWAKRASIRLADLKGQPLIFRESGSNTRHILERALGKRRIEIDPVLELGSREAVREAVALGLGIGFMQERETAGDNRVTPVRIDEMLGTNLATLVCLKRQAKRKTVAAMIRVARDLSSLP